mgnify:CR=1 FL=1
MQNKRGISQAFSPVSQDLCLRQASVLDVFAIQRFLTVCGDVAGPTAQVAGATANSEQLRRWISASHAISLAQKAGQVVGVAGLPGIGVVVAAGLTCEAEQRLKSALRDHVAVRAGGSGV